MRKFNLKHKQHSCYGLKAIVVFALFSASSFFCNCSLDRWTNGSSGKPSKDDISKKDSSGLDSLHRAVQDGNAEAVASILERIDKDKAKKRFHYANEDFPNSVNKQGKTALCRAVEKGYVEIVQLLVNNKHIDLSKGDTKRGLPPLLVVLTSKSKDKSNHEEIALILLEACYKTSLDSIRVKDPNSDRSPLHLAIEHGFDQLAKSLVDKLMVDGLIAQDRKLQTPLHMAAAYCRGEVFPLLFTKLNSQIDLLAEHNNAIKDIRSLLFLLDARGLNVFSAVFCYSLLPEKTDPFVHNIAPMFHHVLTTVKPYLFEEDWNRIEKLVRESTAIGQPERNKLLQVVEAVKVNNTVA